MKKRGGAVIPMTLLCWVYNAWGGGLEDLQTFMERTRVGAAHFEQVSQRDKAVDQSSGEFSFARPGKFRWEYKTPYAQTLVGDGKTLWIWDPDLNQVTRKPMAEALGSTPAALLAGDNTLEKGFRLEEGPASDGLSWVVATPKNRDTGFDLVRLGFSDHVLKRMELKDSFGHVVSIRFDHFEAAPRFTQDTFHFVPPPGADVIQ